MAQEIPRGTVRDTDKRLYWGTYKEKLKSGEVKMRQLWLTEEKFKARRLANRNCSKATRKNNARLNNEAHQQRKKVMQKSNIKHAEIYPIRKLVASAKQRALRKNIEFNISAADLALPEVCPLLGIPLKKGIGKISAGSPSIDRIDATKGYIKGNVWVISFKANAIKQNATIQELELLVANLKGVKWLK